jgi:hypothetical protein
MVRTRGCSLCENIQIGAHNSHISLDWFLNLNLQGYRSRFETTARETYDPHLKNVDNGPSHQSTRQLGRAYRAHGPYLLCFMWPVSLDHPTSQGGSGTAKSIPHDALVFRVTMSSTNHSGAHDGLAS